MGPVAPTVMFVLGLPTESETETRAGGSNAGEGTRRPIMNELAVIPVTSTLNVLELMMYGGDPPERFTVTVPKHPVSWTVLGVATIGP